jgi:hypothetical protein
VPFSGWDAGRRTRYLISATRRGSIGSGDEEPVAQPRGLIGSRYARRAQLVRASAIRSSWHPLCRLLRMRSACSMGCWADAR